MAGMGTLLVKLRFLQKVVFFCSWPDTFQEKYFIECELSKCVFTVL